MKTAAFTIYDASAGSGKTYTLVKEYLKIILTNPNDSGYRNILAITFTNKAVHEMKSRVVDSLFEFSKEVSNEKSVRFMQDIASETGLTTAFIKQKSQKIIKHLIHNYAAFDISTIDKFTHRVIRAFAHDLNLPITFEVALDADSLLVEAVDSVISKAGETDELTKLLIDFVKEKADDDQSWDIAREIFATGKLTLNETDRAELKNLEHLSIADFARIKKNLNRNCAEIEKQSILLGQEAIALIEDNDIDKKSFSSGHFINHLNGIAENNFNSNTKKYFEFDDIKILKNAKDRAEIEAIIPNLLNILQQVYTLFNQQNFYKAFLKNSTPLSLLNTVSLELTKIQQDQNLLSISEFNKLINDQIQNQPAPFIYERLGERYHHFFIDEFQDTSQMQWQNLIPLIDNATSSEFENKKQGTVMLVGDPKQSIYRWRGGKAEQFIALSKFENENDPAENPFNNKDKEVKQLETNYRSYSEVIDFNNQFFKFLSNEFENQDYKNLYDNHSHQKSNDKKGGFVSLTFLPKKEKNIQFDEDEEDLSSKELYLQPTLDKINELIELDFDYKDIAILIRSNKNGILLANYLTENNIPILSSESLLLAASTDVQCLIDVLNYLQNQENNQAKAQFLYYIAKNHQNQMPIHDFMAMGKEIVDETQFELWLKEFGLDFSFATLRKKALYETAELIVSKIVPIQKRSAYIQFFLDLILEHDLKKQAGISDFLDFWNLKSNKLSIPSPEGNNAVRILTIHKSKGLEFPVVIFPFAEDVLSSSKPEKMWLDAEEETVGISRVLVNKVKAVETYNDASAQEYKKQKQEKLLDTINVLYVALTRAEEQLHIISRFNINKGGVLPENLSSFFIKFLKSKSAFEESKSMYSFGNPHRLSSRTANRNQTHIISNLTATLNPKNIKIAQRESLMWGTIQQDAIEFGNVLHEILAHIKTDADVDMAVTQALESGLLSENQKNNVQKMIHQLLNHPDLQDFYANNKTILNEKTILQKNGNTIKPDRMAISATNEVFLLDYKTGAAQPKYKLQLENYQNAIEEMGYKVKRKSIVYIGEEIEIVNL